MREHVVATRGERLLRGKACAAFVIQRRAIDDHAA